MTARSGRSGGWHGPRDPAAPPRPARRRRLDPEEEALWKAVARSARPLNPARRAPAPPEAQTPAAAAPAPPATEPPARPAPIAPFRIGAAAPPPVAATDRPPADDLATHLDRRVTARLRSGKASPEARIDLHGLTLAEAQPALVAFLLGAHAAGRRVVLVITGKGRDRDDGGPIPVPRGVLRHHLPRWLALAPLARIVQGATPSHHRHGGDGAWYVCLRRARPH